MTVDNAFDALIALDPELAATLETAGAQSGITLSPASVSDIIPNTAIMHKNIFVCFIVSSSKSVADQ